MKNLLKLSVLSFFMYGCTSTSNPSGTGASTGTGTTTVSYTQVKSVISQKCAFCHATTPASGSGYTSAPNGILLETDQQIKNQANAIYRESVLEQVMPPRGAAVTLTDDERNLIGTWYKAGSPTS